MLNQVVLVGRLVSDPEVKETSSGTSISRITLAVPRSYKNINGEYETDFISCVLWKLMAINTKEYCRKGDIVGVKGRIESNVYEKMVIRNILLMLLLKKSLFYLIVSKIKQIIICFFIREEVVNVKFNSNNTFIFIRVHFSRAYNN